MDKYPYPNIHYKGLIMYSYILKKNHDNNPVLIRRVDGQMHAFKPIDTSTVARLMERGIIEHQHIILHYSKLDDEELYNLTMETKC